MPIDEELQIKRGTTAKINTYVGKLGEPLIDTDKKTVVIMDGLTLGGHPLAKEKHTHPKEDISSIDASKIVGTIPLANLPAGALERLTHAANQSARLTLTIAQVQNGDTVQQDDTGIMYMVVDETKLGGANAAQAFQEYTAGRASAVPWSGIENKPTTFTPNTHGSNHNFGGTDAIDISKFIVAENNSIKVVGGKLTVTPVSVTDVQVVSDNTGNAIKTGTDGGAYLTMDFGTL